MPSKRFTNVEQFTSDNVLFAGASAYGEAVASDQKSVDYSCPYDLCITGAVLIVKGAKTGDKVCLQVVHPQYGLLSEFVKDWYVAEDRQIQFSLDLNYPANLASGLIVRCVYKATSDTGTRYVMLNYLLHKVLEQV